MIPSYPKIYNVGHPQVSDLLAVDVIVEEKVDGSQFSFMWTKEHGLEARSKGAVISPTDVPALFKPAYETAFRLSEARALVDGWVYRGEALHAPRHNVLAYDRMPEGGFILFDVNDGDERYFSYEEKREIARTLGLPVVPLLFTGRLARDDFDRLLETESILGGQKVEGVVIKQADITVSRLFDTRSGKALMAKHVSERFKEVAKVDWPKTFGRGREDIINRVMARYRTQARWDKAVIHLKEQATLSDSPKDIGPLMDEVVRDVLAECGEEIREALFKEYERDIKRILVHGLPEWYKERLVNQQFGGEK